MLGGLQLQQGVGRPSIQRISFNQFPVVQLALTGANGDLAALRRVTEERYVPALAAVQGVSRVEVTGGGDNALLIAIDPAKLADAKLTMQQIDGCCRPTTSASPAARCRRTARRCRCA